MEETMAKNSSIDVSAIISFIAECTKLINSAIDVTKLKDAVARAINIIAKQNREIARLTRLLVRYSSRIKELEKKLEERK
jgi:seryl-tRNA synthetase